MTGATIETLDWLTEYWPDLMTARLPMATRRPWQARHLDAESMELRDAAAYLDRYFRNPLGVRESPAPLDVNIFQTILDVLVLADDLAAELGEYSVCPPPRPPAYGELDARQYLAYARARLVDEHHDLGEPGPWHDWAWPRIERMYEQVARALVMLYTGQTVRVICPWCLGRTPENPTGGAHTWRVHDLPGGQVAIVCHGQCEPPANLVGTWWGGAPCWPLTEWPRLAKHLPAASQGQVARIERVVARRRPARVARADVLVGVLTKKGAKRMAQQTEEDHVRGASGRA